MSRRQLGPSARIWMAGKDYRDVLDKCIDKLDAFDLMGAIEDCNKAARKMRAELKRRDAEKYGEEVSP